MTDLREAEDTPANRIMTDLHEAEDKQQTGL